MYDFNACVRLQEINLRHPYRSLDEMQKTVSAKLSELQARFPRYIDRVEQLGTELERLGLTPDNTYLYIPRTPYHGLCSAENPYPGMYGAAS